MAIESTINPKNSETPFPKLMKSKQRDSKIVLFIRERVGTVISNEPDHVYGYSAESWIMDNFTDFDGEITLKNK